MRTAGHRFDYSSERQRHEKFVGRAGLLARLDQLLVDNETDRWVVVTGGPGMGKSALLAAWLVRHEAAGAVVPHHFIRRGTYDWDDPAKLVGSLVAQLEDGFPELREPDGDELMHPATRLARALSRVSESVLRSRGERLVVLIDGLDEYDPPVGSSAGDPLAAFLPNALPAGVRLLCASRPRHPYVSSLEARDGKLVQIDLDAPDSAADNDATVRAFWEAAAVALDLDASFVDEAVARAAGNVQHAVQLRKRLDVLSAEQRPVEDIPRGLAALIEKAWERIAIAPVVVDGLGILCAAREALTLDELGAAVGWTGDAPRRTFVRAARELLVETRRLDGQREYRLHHDSIRAHIAGAIGDVALRVYHGALARRFATWPAPADAGARRYALRHALIHRVEAGDWANAWQLAADMSFLEAKCRELGVHETEADVVRMAERCRVSDDAVRSRRFGDLARALGRESHWLRSTPEATTALVWNRLRRSGWSAGDLDGQLRVPTLASFLRVRHAMTRESPALVRDLVGHSHGVMACAVTLDGQRIVSASEDRTLKVWDLESGRLLTTLEGHADWVFACAVMDGQRVISASLDHTLKIWDIEGGRQLATLKSYASRVSAFAVMPDRRRMVSASWDQTLKVWDLESGRVLATMEGHAQWVTACAVTPDGRHVVSALAEQTLKVWDLESGRALATMEGHTDVVTACAVTPDGRRVVSASQDRTLKVWDLESGCALTTMEGHRDVVTACAVTPDGRRVVSTSNDKTLKIWDLESGRQLATFEGHASGVRACAVTPDGRRVVSASEEQALKVWDLDSEGARAIFEGHASGVRACAATPDGRHVVSASDDKTLKIWDLESGRQLATFEGHASGVRACAVTPDGRHVVSASDDKTLKIWDLESGRQLATFEGHASGVRACAVTPDGRRVVSVSEETLKVWDLDSGRTLTIFEGRADGATNGKRFVSAWRVDHTGKIWDLDSGCVLAPDLPAPPPTGHTGSVTACAVTPDGQRVVSASKDRTLKIWDFESGRQLATLEGHTDTVTACVVTPDGRHVVSASDDKTLKIWDLESGRQLATLEGHAGRVTACAVTLDGRRVVSVSDDKALKVWDYATCACLFTHRGDASYTAVATDTAGVVAGDSAGGLWFLDWPPRDRCTTQLDIHDHGQYESRSAPEIFSSRPIMKKHTILFVAANPIGTSLLALGEEARAIQVELERSGYRDCFELETRWAAQPLDLLRELRKLKPTVVHFSGHGGRSLMGQGAGLFFQGPDGRAQVVTAQALHDAFGAAGSSVKLVVLSACYSDAQAEALRAHIDCVVGMSGSIGDDAARNFAIGFYGGLGERESIAAAFRQGCAAISLEGLRDSDRPRLKVRDGVDASQLVLAADPS